MMKGRLKLKIKEGFIKRKIGNKFLVVTTGELSKTLNIMIELNDTSSEIWDGVANNLNVNDIAKKLVEKYGIDMEKAISDVESIIAQMTEAGVFE